MVSVLVRELRRKLEADYRVKCNVCFVAFFRLTSVSHPAV